MNNTSTENKKNIIRSRKIKVSVLASFFVKGGMVLTNLLMIPLLLDYLEPVKYGIWLTVNSIVTWFMFFDVGLGNGLRNKFAELKAKKNHYAIKGYVSTAYFSLSLISILFLTIFLFLNQFLDWTKLLNTDSILFKELNLFILIVFISFSMRLTLNLISSILLGDQKPEVSGLLNFIGQLFSLIGIYCLVTIDNSNSLIYTAIMTSIIPILILLVSNLILMFYHYKRYSPNFKSVNSSYLKELFGIGSKFFIIQSAFVVLYTTDNFIITHYFDPSKVVPYNISFRYFGVTTMFFSIINTPFWSAYTDAYHSNDIDWIKKVNTKLKFVWGIFFIVTIIMLLCADFIFFYWIGDDVVIPFELNFIMALNAILLNWRSMYIYFINGIGKIKLQTRMAIFGALLHIPLAIIIIENTDLGISGVMLSTVMTGFIGAFWSWLQYKKIINGQAKGIWNQ